MFGQLQYQKLSTLVIPAVFTGRVHRSKSVTISRIMALLNEFSAVSPSLAVSRMPYDPRTYSTGVPRS